MILASDNFRDEEYQIPRDYWESKGFTVQTASKSPLSTGRFGLTVHNDFQNFFNVNVDDFDGVFWVGGGGCLEYLQNLEAKHLCQTFLEQQKIIGAICAAPRLLLHWGFLKGHKCTGWNGDYELNERAKKGNAIFIDAHVYIDGKFITADGPDSAEACAIAYAELLQNE